MSRLHTEKTIEYSSKADYRFKKQKRKFIKENDRDDHYNYSCSEDILFHQAECLVYSPKKGEKPWYTNCCLMVILDIFMVGWIPRYYLCKETKIVEYEMKKYIKK